MDMITIPTKEAILALDMVAAQVMTSEDEGIAMSNSGEYVKLRNLFKFHGISGKFSQMVLDAAKAEGRRKMFQRQPLHLRTMATKNSDELLTYQNQYEEQ